MRVEDLAASQSQVLENLRQQLRLKEVEIQNYTRFVIIERTGGEGERESKAEEANRVSIVFATLDKPGALFFALEVLAKRSLNMTKLESRPIPGKPWEYMFYLDLALPPDRVAFAEALEELKKHTEELRVLGMYKA